MRRASLTVPVILLTLLVLAPAARGQATWYSVYEQALEDISAGHWDQAVDNLERALQLKPAPETNARTYGVWRRDYFPHYHLGLVYFNLGEYRRALEQWELSERAGAIARNPELLEQLDGYRQVARGRLEEAGPDREIARRIEQEINSGLRLKRRGELDSAMIKFESVLTLDPANDLAREQMNEIGALLARRDSLAGLERQVEQMMADGSELAAEAQYADALEEFRAVLRIDPDHDRALALADSVRGLMEGEAEQRRRRLRLVLDLIEQGRAARGRGDLIEAARLFDRAEQLEPSNREARSLAAETDSLLALRSQRALQDSLLADALRLIRADSLLAARDTLVRARQLGPHARLDSLYTVLENRMAESERRYRLRDIPQLALNPADSVTEYSGKLAEISGNASDDDGILRIVLEFNGADTTLFFWRGEGRPPVRQSFQHTVALGAGENRLKLTVFDSQENNAAAVRRLIYSPPLWESPLVRWVAALALALGVFAGYYVKRNTLHLLFNRLRRRPFEVIAPNPFIVGNPIRSREMFFGREDDFRFVKNKVDNEKYGSLIVLFGERRAGKTSVLYQILGGRLGPSYLPVFLDMQAMAINDDREFLGRVAELAVDQLGARLGRMDLSVFEDASRNPYPQFEKFIDRALESIGEDRMLLLVDEYELIEDKVADGKLRKEIFHFLSGLVEHKQGLFLVFAGNHRLQDRRRSFWEPLLQRCDYRNISYLTPNDTRRLITEPVRGKVFYMGGTVRDIMRLTAGQPFYTQLVCRNIVELLNAERRNFFYEDDISTVVREIIDNPPAQLIYFWAGMELVEKLVLSAVAEAARSANSFPGLSEMRHAMKKFNTELPENELKEVCERMAVREVLERGPRESYRFRMDLYRQWIREEHNLYAVAREFEREAIAR